MTDQGMQSRFSRFLFAIAIGGLFHFSGAVAFAQDGDAGNPTQWIVRESKHLRLASDVNEPELLEDLTQSFDAAVPQWLAFWGMPESRLKNWKIDGYLMRNVDAFRERGALPASITPFRHGFSSPGTIWVRYQDTRYYNRHLVLHEGVHSLAFELFGAGGPSWFMEGTAELLALHRERVIVPKRLSPESEEPARTLLAQSMDPFTINQFPRNRADTPGWGRYKIVARDRDANSLPTLKSVLKLPMELNGKVEAYTWCWAAASLFSQAPESREAFLKAASRGSDQSEAFTSEFYRDVAEDWPVLSARWRLLLNDLDYGFDWSRHRIALSTSDPRATGAPVEMRVSSDQAWHSTGQWFPRGARLRFAVSGQCQVTTDWTSGPAGISIEFHRGAPLGQLQVCVLPIASPDQGTLPPMQIQSVITKTDVARQIASGNSDADAVDSLVIQGTQEVLIREPSWVLLRINLPIDHQPIASDSALGYQVKVVPVR
ncbi:hypothetical protein [Rhodopirellula halodulae]|nr:hypothetical protein [Rhodopirellula sp. JC740]